MTLFKKVFQNQSRPATEGEALDDAALRRAFLEGDDAEPLKLDPFGPLDDTDDRMTFQAVDDLDLKETGTALEADAEQGRFGIDDDAADDAHPSALAPEETHTAFETRDGDDTQVEPVDTYAEDATVTGTCVEAGAKREPEDVSEPTDEDIAAVLDRAMAAGAPELAPAQQKSANEWQPDAQREFSPQVNGDAPETAKLVENSPEAAASETQKARDGDFSAEQLALLSASRPNDSHMSEPVPSRSEELDLSSPEEFDAMPAPAAGRAARRAGRVKTRLLGFNRGGGAETDPFDQTCDKTATAQSEKYPVGWLVIVEGPGMGHAFSLFTGASMIGRGEDQVIRLDFGDNSISRQNHAAIAYDEEQNKFFLGHGGKSNIIRRNARPVLSTEELHHADLIRIGETTLRFVALCGSDFQWNTAGGTDVGAV